MVATELITGMEDIVQHIKDLEIKNKELEEENKLIKDEAIMFGKSFKKLEEENEDNLASLNFYTEQCAELKDERKQLKEEQLTEENAIQYVYENTDEYDDWVYSSTVYQELQEENKKLQFDYDTRGDIVKGLKETIDKLKEENKKLEDRAVANYDTRMKENKKQLQKMKELEMKSNAKSDIIKNMFECITADLEEVEDGFYIKRDWGHKYIDTWNEIVTQEYKDALKEINEQLEGIEWETDGFQFDLNIVDESEDESEEESEEEEEAIVDFDDNVVFLYPKDHSVGCTIQDPEHPEDNYSFGDNSKSKIGDNYTMKRILKNGSIKDCVGAYAYCMFVKGGKLYYQGRSSSGPAHIRTIKGEKTTMEFPY